MSVLLATALLAIPITPAHADDSCPGTAVTCGVGADPGAGDFHGMVAATDASWVLSLAARSGTTAGCGDCTWRVALACPTSSPSDPSDCAGNGNPLTCSAGQLLYRLYLTTAAVTDDVVGELCLGGPSQLIPIGDQARADVARYLATATPPHLVITIRPSGITLAGLPTEFQLRPPRGLRPTEFGGPQVTETITLHVDSTSWSFGDGPSGGWQSGDPDMTHRYLQAGSEQLAMTARWGATYTVGYVGQTFGPYDATGQLTAREVRNERVATSSPVLVSR